MSPGAERHSGRLAVLLAGLQAGMVAALVMLLWMGLSARWQQRSFWTSENLLATAFYGSSAVHNSFSTSTFSGLALYLLLYSTLGCIFAVAAGVKATAPKLLVAGIAGALIWYYVSFHFIWQAISPLVPLLYPVRPTIVGHVLFGALIARFPHYLPRTPPAVTEADGVTAPASTEVSEG